MATLNEKRTRLNFAQELPPITLSNTSISGLVSLIPVLVAMTSRAPTPCFDNEQDKPAWWPEDIQWKNPKYYSAYMGDNILKLLRKVVHSCYSYHGVEDLLCRLDETPALEVVDISDEAEDNDGNTSADNETPVYVCCFCLEEFGSHEQVSSHQQLCRDRPHEVKRSTAEDLRGTPIKLENSDQTKMGGCSDFLQSTVPHPVALTFGQSFGPSQSLQTTQPETAVKEEVSVVGAKPTKKPASVRRQSGNKVVSILKTRSQKKLDQIMERHNKKQLMIKECSNLLEVPKTGAWWVRKKGKDKIASPSVHPSQGLTKREFLSSVSLTLRREAEAQQTEKDRKEVDLDCEIICVEGPLSSVPLPVTQDTSNTVSPRGSKSLMSQLARDEGNSRRRLSFCFVEDEWADKEALNEGRDPLQTSLLTLDLSSPLGQRIKKYVNADGQMNVIKDLELYSKTEIRDENKLRVRTFDFKVTFRKKCRASSYVHTYKFNRQDLRDFEKRLKSGLSFRSWNLMKSMPKCKLVLKRMTEEDIRLFNEEKKVTFAQYIAVDDDLCITQIDIPESQVKSHNSNAAPTAASVTPTAPSPWSGNPSQPTFRQRPLANNSCLPHHQPHQQIRRPHPYSHPHHHHHPHRHQHQHQHHHHQQQHSPFIAGSLSSSKSHLHGQNSTHSPSPPHVPNIFRNRTSSNSPSPSRPPLNREAIIKSHLTLAQRMGEAQRRAYHANFKNALLNLVGPHHRHHHQRNQVNAPPTSQPQPQPQPRGSGSSPPSGFSSGVIISQHRRPIGPNSSRRKQAMSQLRHDDFGDRSVPKTAPSTSKDPVPNKNFVNLAKISSVGSKHQSSSSSHLHSSPSASGLSSCPSPSRSSGSSSTALHSMSDTHKAQDLSKLSNFEYFSIKQGKITPGHRIMSSGHSSSPNTSPKKVSTPRQEHVSTPSRPYMPNISYSPIANGNNRGKAPTFASDSHQKHDGPHRASGSVQQREGRRPGPYPGAGQSPINRSSQPSRAVPESSGDDDVMEVICIDD